MISDARRRAVALALPLVLAIGLGACASEPDTPAEIRRARVEARLEDTFTDRQASCILDDLDAATIKALAGSADVASAEASARYSDAVVRCVSGAAESGSTTTTPPAPTTTTKP